MSRGIVITAVAGGAAILAAATVAGVAVVNAASATEPAQPTRSVVAEPGTQPMQAAEVTLPDVAKPSEAPAPGEPTVITVPAAGNGQGGSYADDDDAEGSGKASDDRETKQDDKQYGNDESDDQYGNDESDDQYENGDDESSYAGQEQDEDHGDEGEHDDDDD